MMTKKEFAEYNEFRIEKLRVNQNILFRAFVINYIGVLLMWLIGFIHPLMNWLAFLSGVPAAILSIQFLGWLAVWKIAGVVLFLIPALAIWWERCRLRKL
jgi:hypothetical protein